MRTQTSSRPVPRSQCSENTFQVDFLKFRSKSMLQSPSRNGKDTSLRRFQKLLLLIYRGSIRLSQVRRTCTPLVPVALRLTPSPHFLQIVTQFVTSIKRKSFGLLVFKKTSSYIKCLRTTRRHSGHWECHTSGG